MTKSEIEQLFENNYNCYADTKNDDIVIAMTKDKFVEIVSQMQLPVKPEIADDSNKIKWFMELAIKMYDTGYCDASIYSIDTDAWDEYRVNDKLTPSQAIAEEESNG